MAFTDSQVRQLKAKLDSQYVKARKANGSATLHYIEGWHAIAEANRIFGFDGWDRRTIVTDCVWTGRSGDYYAAAYTAKVRIRVRAGDTLIVREGSGSGDARALSPGEAHALALKSAETDATKRALATFGNPFGLALYDREQTGVRKTPKKAPSPALLQDASWTLHSAEGRPVTSFDKPDAFAEALKKALTEADAIEQLYKIWEQNVGTVRLLHKLGAQHPGSRSFDGTTLVAYLKSCAAGLAEGITPSPTEAPDAQRIQAASSRLKNGSKIDKSVLTIGEPKRIRSKEHLRYVAQQPCLICGRRPSHAHHIRYAQPRGLALKVSDEFTVPLCAIHHSENHSTGNERRWWEERKIDPLAVAAKLWSRSMHPDRDSIGA